MNVNSVHITTLVKEHLRNLGTAAESTPMQRYILFGISDKRIALFVQ